MSAWTDGSAVSCLHPRRQDHRLDAGAGGDLYFYRVDGDLRGRLEKIDTGACPLYLLTGEYDFSCTPDDTRRTAAAIEGASVTIMEQLGHFPMSENPEQFRRYIAPVLGQILKQTTSGKQGEYV
jgi:pimeloyl-ACP methyl ester carboxylesterase